MKETLEQLIIRDILTETSGEIDLSNYEETIKDSIIYFYEGEAEKFLKGFAYKKK